MTRIISPFLFSLGMISNPISNTLHVDSSLVDNSRGLPNI